MGEDLKTRIRAKAREIGFDAVGFAGVTISGRDQQRLAQFVADGEYGDMDWMEAKLERHPGQLQRAAVELAKDWRTEKYLQKLEALLIVADKDTTLVITGAGDVLEPEHNVVAVGSGGNYALAAARGLYDYENDAEEIGRKAMQIAADICVYTNSHFTLETLDL